MTFASITSANGMSSPASSRVVLSGLAAAIAALSLSVAPAHAQAVVTFPVPTASSTPSNIAVGADGNLWFTEHTGNKIGKITPAGVISEFVLPTANSQPFGIALGGDGNVWFTEVGSNKIGKITPAGAITEIALPTAAATPRGITLGPDGLIWFTEFDANQIGRVNANGTISEFITAGKPFYITVSSDNNLFYSEFMGGQVGKMSTAGVVITECVLATIQPTGIAPGPDGNLWVMEQAGNKVGKLSPTCGVSDTAITSSNTTLRAITPGPDGALWFAEPTANKLGRIATTGALTEFALPSGTTDPQGIVTGPDGNIWFTTGLGNQIGRITPPATTSPLVASILPASRSVQTTNFATAFATIINTGPAATACGIAPIQQVSGTFSFQTTSPTTNALTGTINTRVPIAAGGLQTFVVAYKANGAFSSSNVPFGFDCAATPATVNIVGVNTLLLTFSASPVADMIAVGVTPSNDGFAHLTGAGNTGVFAVATANIGIATALTARVRFFDPATAASATVCETFPTTGVCKAPPSATVTRTVGQNENATWAVFFTATGTVANDAARFRAALEFVDGGSVVRGSTSTAVTTQ